MLRIRILVLSSLVALVSLSGTVFAQGNLDRDANACWHSEDAEQIIASCTRLLQSGRYRQHEAAIYSNRGVGYRRRGEFNRAIADFNEAIRINPASGFNYRNRGIVYMNSKDYERAIIDFEKAVEVEPREALNYLLCAKAAMLLKDRYRAIVNLNEAISLNPSNPEAYYLRGVHYDETGEKQLAIQDFRKAAALGDKDAAEELRTMGVDR
jgi:tetratricopeptide (TPR) repeat protein